MRLGLNHGSEDLKALRTVTAPAGSRKPALWVYVAAFFAYSALFWLGYWTSRLAGGIAPFWLATGFGIWLVLRFGGGMVFVIIIGAVPAYYAMAQFSLTELRGVGLVALTGIGRALAAWAGAWLWRWGQARWEKSCGRFYESIGCVIVALASALVAATVGCSVAVLLGYRTLAGGYDLWRPWVAGDAVGVLFSLPLLLSARTIIERVRAAGAREWGRGAVVLAAAVGGSVLVFGRPGGITYLFVLFPVLWLATVWFESTGARLVALFYASAIAYAAMRGHGPFVVGGFWYSDLTLQLLLVVVGFVALLLPPLCTRRSLLDPWPLVLLFGGWAVSGVMFGLEYRQQERANALNFSHLADNARAAIEQRLTTYMDALRISESFVATTPTLGREAWLAFSETLRLPQRYPGILGVGIAYPVAPQATAAFEQRVREDGAPNFSVRALPGAQSQGGEQYVMTYVTPLSANQAGLGRDLATETNRRVAADAARDTGQPQLTGRIALTSDPRRRPGFMFFLPIYRTGAPLATVAERRAAFLAWVSAPFVIDDFMPEALRSRRDRVRVYLFDGGQLDAGHLLFTTEPAGQPVPKFAHVNTVGIGGKEFTLGWNVGAGFEPNRQSILMWLALSLAVITVLLAEVVLSLQSYREQAEELARHRLAAQRESEARFQAIFEQAAMGVTLIDLATGRYVRANQRFSRIVGYSADEILDTDFRAFTHPNDLAETAEYVRQLAAGEILEFSQEKRYRHKDGHVIWGRVNVTAMASDGPVPVFGIGTVEDITARKQAEADRQALEQQLRQLNATLEERVADRTQQLAAANQELEAFSYSVSHDLRTPLRHIAGFAEMLAMDSREKLSPDSKHYLKTIAESSDEMDKLIDNLLEFSRMGRGEKAEVQVSLDALVAEVRGDLKTPTDQRRIDWKISALGTVVGDPDMLRQVFVNLLSNAVKYTQPRDPTTIEIGCAGTEHGRLIVFVRDNGVGFDPRFAGKLFGVFQRLHRSDEFEGIGIGLANVRRIVARHGGRVWAESVLDRGACFYFTLLPSRTP